MSGKYALIIGNTEYTDPGLAQLTAPGKDAEDFARVLQDKDICAFDNVSVLVNQSSAAINEAIDEFFEQKKQDDLLVLYFSGHGVRDELGALYLAVKNTNRFRMRSTAIKSDFIKEAMNQSRSRRQVLILDCCNSGAFEYGTKSATGVSIGTATSFEAGYGRIILTASDSTQFAWEGDKVIGETDNSLFTHFLVDGLEGEADMDGDGRITVDELYDYAYEKVRLATPKQTPSKFSSKQQGEIVLRQNMRIEDVKPLQLPDELMDEIEDTRPYVREAAVQKLAKILRGKNIGMARSAKEALERIEKEDDSRQVSRTAKQALEIIRQVEQKAEEEGAIKERIEYELKQHKETDKIILLPRWVSVFWITLGWAIGWASSMVIISLGVDSKTVWTASWAIGGAIGGFNTAITLRIGGVLSNWKNMFWITLGWAISGAISGAIYRAIDETNIAIAFGTISLAGAIGGFGTAIILHRMHVLNNWKSIFRITLGWTISFGIGSVAGGAVYLAILLAIIWGNSIAPVGTEDTIVGATIGGLGAVISWAIGGCVTAITLQIERVLPNWKITFWFVLGWAFGLIITGAISGAIVGTILSTIELANLASGLGAINLEIVGAIGGFITAMTLQAKRVRPDRKSLFWGTLGWAILGAIGLGIGGVILGAYGSTIGGATENAIFGASFGTIGGALAAPIGGFVMIWQIRNELSNRRTH